MPETTNFNIPFLDGTELVRDYPTFSEDLANAVDGNLLIGTTSDGTNTALGDGAFESNTTGSQNTALGERALQNNTEGGNTVAVGRAALLNNTTGTDNTAVGQASLLNNTTGDFNTAVGHRALQDCTEGFRNTAVGQASLRKNTEGVLNTAFGQQAMQNNTTGDNNTAVGRAALFFNNGDNNTAVGLQALITNTTSANTMGLGAVVASSSNTVNNEITLGNNQITSLRCNVTTISSLSDVRDKTDIVDTQHGLDTLNKIRPVDFTWARRDGTFGSAPDIGFIAQELASVEDETGDAHRLRLTLRNNPEKLEATPGRLIPILVKAVQELSAKNDELEARIEALEAK